MMRCRRRVRQLSSVRGLIRLITCWQRLLHCLGDFEGAINEYNRAIAINPRYGIAYYNLGVSYDSLKQVQKALTAYHQAELLVPDLADTQLNIGWLLYELGRNRRSQAAVAQGAYHG